VEAFNPEDLLVDREWTTPLLDDCPYVARLMEVTLSDLKMMGFKGVEASDLRASDDVRGKEPEFESEYDEDDSMAEG
ncbi:portal protein, partial [Escherichia coli]|uniref:portal protein n=1 Tax=Escherichia coli TaxID=562 RepID=UPI003CFE1DBC